MSPSRLAVKHPITTVMLTLMAVLLGAIGFQSIAVDLLPNIEFPMIAVAARYPGAAPEEVENLVTRRLEEAIARMAGLDRITSSSREGLAIITARFRWGTNLDQVAIDIRERIDMVRRFLPSEIESITVIKADVNARPIMRVDLWGEKDIVELTDIANDIVKPALERIDGVASVDIVGGVTRKVFLNLDARQLQTYGLAVSHISSALRQENVTLSGGDVTSGQRRARVRTIGDLSDLDDLAEVRIVSPLGPVLTVRDVASIVAGPDEVKSFARYNGKPSVCLMVQKQSGTNTVQVARQVKRAIEKLGPGLPAGANLVITEDQSGFINRAINTVSSSAVGGALLAIIVLFLFLQDWRSTIVIGVSIPVSLIFTFALMYFSNMTFNLMSIGGLALGVGMLVDNSIVVLENIHRHHTKLGLEPKEAAVRGTEEVAMAITASTLTNLVVFLPIVFTQDMSSHLFRQLALVVTFSIGCSLVAALTLVPVGASWLLSIPRGRQSSTGVMAAVARLIERVTGLYTDSFSRFLDRPRLAYLGIALAIGLTAIVYPLVGTEFLPSMDRGEIVIRVSGERGMQLALTESIIRQLEKAVAAMPETLEYTSFVGGSAGSLSLSAGGSETASLFLRLKRGKEYRSTRQIAEELLAIANQIPGARIRVSQITSVVGEEEMMGSPIDISVRGDDLALLRALAREIGDRIAKIDSVRDVNVGLEEGYPEVQVRVDRKKAAYSGLTAAQIGSMLRSSIQGETATRFRMSGTEYDVVVRLDSAYRDSIPDIENLLLMSSTGQITPLWQVADVRQEVGPISINRSNQTRVTNVRAQVSGRDLGSVVADVRREVAKMSLPDGYVVQFGGQTQEMMSSFLSLGFVLIVALLLDYMVLASQFESLVHPVTVMMSVPLAAVGSILALFVSGRAINVPSIIGLVTLAGIVVNNAIVFVDYANQLRREGMTVRAALLQTGATRLRPILMTSLTTVFGLIPLALGGGMGAELTGPLAMAVMGGLITSTFLTLFIVPVIYESIDRLVTSVRSRFSRAATLSVLVLIVGFSVLGVDPGRVSAGTYELTLDAALDRAVTTSAALRVLDARIRAATILVQRAQGAAALMGDPTTYEEAKTKFLVPAQAANGLAVLQRYREALIENVKYGATVAFYTVWRLQELSRSASALAQATSEQVELVKLSQDAGLVIYRDVAAARSRFYDTLALVSQLDASKATATLNLLKLTGYEPSDTITLKADNLATDMPAWDPTTDVARALSSRYEIFKAEKDLATALLDLQLAQTYPSVVPGHVEYAQAIADEAQATLDMQRREISFQVRSAYPAIEAARMKHYARSEAYHVAHENWRVTLRRSQQGMATEADLLLAGAQSDQAASALTEALCEWEIAKARYRHMLSKGSSSAADSGSRDS